MRKHDRASGQAILMVTLGLLAMFGLAGLAVDTSYSYFLEKQMQAAADAAALSAVKQARDAVTTVASMSCGSISCYSTPTDCTTVSGTAATACTYAGYHGFTGTEVRIVASDDGTRPPTVLDATCNPDNASVKRPPTAGCVNTKYWVTVRIARNVPQLFSAVLGNTTGLVSARATAAVLETEVQGSLLLTNRVGDIPNGVNLPNTAPPRTTNLELGGSGTVRVPGGIHLASSSSTNGAEAGRIQGGGNGNSFVLSPYTYVRTGGTIGGNQSANWICTAGGSPCPPQSRGDGPQFYDPMEGKGQPPLNTSLTYREVLGGVLTDSICPSGVCPPGIYYATEPDCNGCQNHHASGDPIRVRPQNFPSGVTFGDSNVNNLNDFIFIGGMDVSTNTTINLEPARYVFAGSRDPDNIPVLNVPNGVHLIGGPAVDADPTNNDIGRILIFTDFRTSSQRNTSSSYGSIATPNQIDTIYSTLLTRHTTAPTFNANGLAHSNVSIQAGQNANSVVRLQGLTKGNAEVIAAGLDDFAPTVMWQDQHNSGIVYTNTGTIASGVGCGTNRDSPCNQALDDNGAPQLEFWATVNTQYEGVVYQPRGAWTALWGGSGYSGPIQIITGAMKVQGSPQLTLTGVAQPLTVFSIALVE